MKPEDVAEVDRIMKLSDEEIKSELVKEGKLVAAQGRLIFEKAIVKVQDARIEALEAALRKITDLIDSEADDPLDDAIRIARAALGPDASSNLTD